MTQTATPDFAILLAAERSGTHLLGSILGNAGAGAWLGEVANAIAATTDDPVGFFAYQSLYRRQHPDRVVPSEPNMRHLIEGYLDHLREVAAGWSRPLVLDVKYTHVASFAGGWWHPFWRPLLVSIAVERGFPIIHLIRRKVAQTVISSDFALATGQWKLTSADQRRDRTIRVAREGLIARATELRDQVRLAQRWLGGLSVVPMAYEALLDPASPSWHAYSAATGRPVGEVRPDYVKAIPSYARIIENLPDIADLLDIDIDDPFWDQPR